MLMRIKKYINQSKLLRPAILFLSGLVIVTFSGWLGDIAYAFYREIGHNEINKSAADGYALTTAFFGILFFSTVTMFLGISPVKISHLRRDSSTEKRETSQVVILCCSPIDARNSNELTNNKIIKSKEHNAFVFINAMEEKIIFETSITKAIKQIEEKGLKINWQQQLRALENKKHLQKIYLVGSNEMSQKWKDDSSDLDRLKDFLQSFYQYEDQNRSKVEVIVSDGTANKDSVDDYYRLFSKCIDKAEKSNIDNTKILVDVTGGQVPASLGGSLATLHNEVGIQYINTSGDTHSYNAYAEKEEPRPL